MNKEVLLSNNVFGTKVASSVKISGGTFSKEIYGQYIESGYHSEQDGDKWLSKNKIKNY